MILSFVYAMLSSCVTLLDINSVLSSTTGLAGMLQKTGPVYFIIIYIIEIEILILLKSYMQHDKKKRQTIKTQ